MTNKEKFREELFDLLGYNIAVNKQTGEPVACERISCEKCLFKDEPVCLCNKPFKEWLNKEYIKPIKTIKASELAVDTKVLAE